MTDNFNLIKPLLDFTDPSKFYYIQLLARKKENKDSKSVKTIKDFYVSNMDYLESHEEHIKELCTFFTARAYIRMSRRSWEDVYVEMLKQMVDILKNKQFEFTRKAFSKACGRTQSESRKRWIIDLDRDDYDSNRLFETVYDGICFIIDTLHTNDQHQKYQRLETIPTPNGLHILTEPFNIKKFLQLPAIKEFGLTNDDIQKNNPTILFAPF